MNDKFVSASDVAKRAGVSRSAVSRTFTTGASVSEKTRRKVMAAAEELGYKVNLLARTLHMSRSDLVGVVGKNLSSPYISAQIDALSAALSKHDLQCILVNLAQVDGDITKSVERLLEYRVRTVVLLSGAAPDEVVRICAANGTRLVLINRTMPAAVAHADMIEADSATGGRLAARRLIQAGCQNVAVLVSASRTHAKRARAEAFIAEMDRSGVAVTQWREGPHCYETGADAARTLLARPGIDGIFAVSDELALGALNTARHELGFSVPEDLSIIGFDDAPISGWSSHDLTTVRQSLSALTEATLQAVMGPANGPSSRRSIPVKLVERGSVR
ncbi:transcriptional regulator, LacI family [Cohaesibacter marisflavi]|uniref:Transcriptional regulator, LacI family n=1 Tax=Cohaesibacter marisflavi TaxID=655353 RepID=A0A1I5J8J5_9HYPH|nr:LacI family DNA-binding transcriptional regulator [Cohaesibacter marisflavi]SFO68960.1 transcriptional regulator, LacI family [Cohaesibacter marisflavi]